MLELRDISSSPPVGLCHLTTDWQTKISLCLHHNFASNNGYQQRQSLGAPSCFWKTCFGSTYIILCTLVSTHGSKLASRICSSPDLFHNAWLHYQVLSFVRTKGQHPTASSTYEWHSRVNGRCRITNSWRKRVR